MRYHLVVTFHFRESVEIEVHYETPASVKAKMDLYTRESLRGIAFWRIGQEAERFWENRLR